VIRPQPATWFEIIAAREDALIALESLARAECAEIEPVGGDAAKSSLAAVAPLLRDYIRLAQRYRGYWPTIGRPAAACDTAPSEALGASLAVIRAWSDEADPIVHELGQAEAGPADARDRIAALRADLDALNARHGLPQALSDVARACWCFQNLEDAGAVFSRITGWTSDARKLVDCVRGSKTRALVHFPPVPEGLQAPLLLQNPDWIQPFEIFSRLVGMPGRYSTDPTGLLAFVAPVLFGYMFGDVFQGLVLVVVGLALQRRWPMLRLLVAGGFAAIGFGFAFGSAGSVHGLVPALWLQPLEDPLPVLVAPLVFGALLLGFGLALNGLEAYWRGQFTAWLGSDAGLLALYAGAMIAFVHPAGIAIAAAGAVLYIAGRARRERRAIAALSAVGELIEKFAQILINTLSFVRVGAFAMAHAGLSSGLVAIAEATGNCVGEALLLLLGNALIIAIEAMMASIQTTRLVLLEFFARFFVSTGREFNPLSSPSHSPEEKQHESKA